MKIARSHIETYLVAALFSGAVAMAAAAQAADLLAVAGDPSGAVAVGARGTVFFSGAGHTNFQPAQIPAIASDLRGCTCVEASLYYAVGDGGTILKSTGVHGAAFVAEASGVGADLHAVAVLQNRVVAVGAGGTIVRSAALSGGGWTAVTSPVTETLHGVAGTTVASIAVGEGGVILWGGPSGSPWEALEGLPGTGAALYAVTVLGDGRFLTVGAAGTVLRSEADGRTWTLMPAPAAIDLYGVAAKSGAGQPVVVVGAGGQIYTSIDAGQSWEAATSGVDRALRGVVYTGIDFLATGDYETLLRSLDLNGMIWADQTPAKGSTWGSIKNQWR